MIRSLEKDQTFEPLMKLLSEKISQIDSQFETQKRKLHDRLLVLKSFMIELTTKEREYAEASARMLSFSIAEVLVGILLLEQASLEKETNSYEKSIQIALRWIDRTFSQLKRTDQQYRNNTKAIASEPKLGKELQSMIIEN